MRRSPDETGVEVMVASCQSKLIHQLICNSLREALTDVCNSTEHPSQNYTIRVRALLRRASGELKQTWKNYFIFPIQWRFVHGQRIIVVREKLACLVNALVISIV